LYLKENLHNYLLAICVSGDLQTVGFKKSNVVTSSIPTTPLWLLTHPIVNFSLHSSNKSSLLLSIEAILSVFDYLIQQASSELNYVLLCQWGGGRGRGAMAPLPEAHIPTLSLQKSVESKAGKHGFKNT